ncbi:four helix bundle protein [Algoriphagus alkaliphilus]|uniref:Four helix bundle protein n=1 Tax=Algoriphagus alkaliphilus TaxID=279824 RepID=A0A1G5V2L5_9BACT|nr:four helix bundle protein [Algoriphagus alkaliphilus]MBA4300667.1 four helix bundle protein [Cyclobacterium sp.]SDA39235.1 four helix bundle protein [Algoriphagus alkaliphilus]
MHNYKELNVWKRSIKLCASVYKLTSTFPNEERFGLISQMRRASVSVPSNIAEGGGRRTNNEFVHFLGVAHGSICELESQLYVSVELEFSSFEAIEAITSELTEIQKMLFALIQKFESKS